MYQYTDKKLKKVRFQNSALFRKYRATINFDELNVINNTKQLYSKLEDVNYKMYEDIANKYYMDATKSERKLNPGWLLALLTGYDYITKYVYKHEVERKRARLAESILATKNKTLNFRTAFNLWWRQTSQYAINITDEATLQGYKDIGSKYVKWNTNIDGRECQECRDRSNKVYPINKAPRKSHYNCRCYYTPVNKGEKND